MKQVVLGLLLLGLVCSLVSSAIAEEMTMIAPEEFAILPWGGTPADPEILRGIKECGFNLAGFVSPDGLDQVRDAGLKCLVMDPSIRVGDAETKLDRSEIDKRVAAMVKRVGDHPAVFGYYLRDEPGADLYPGLAAWADSVKKADPDAVAYINLYPNYASPDQMNRPTYDDYVESYINTVNPKFVSYDHYALMDDGTVRDGYFQNLESVRAAALRHNLPFWNIVLSVAHFRYAEPTEAGFRFQMYTTLAYGARGISYFTYFSGHNGNYRLAPIDQYGQKTPTWEMLRNVNRQLLNLAPTYVKLKSVNVFHYPDVPEGCRGLETSKYLSSMKGTDLLVGEFEGPDGQPFVLVVNKNLHTSTNFRAIFKEPGPVQKVDQYTGKIVNPGSEEGWLAAGQGMLLCLKKQ